MKSADDSFPRYRRVIHVLFILCLISFRHLTILAQVDSLSGDDEDYSLYENLEFADGATKRFCTSKVLDLSPSKLVSLSYDFQGPYLLHSDSAGPLSAGTDQITSAHGIRIGANVPVISRNSIIIQIGGTYAEQHYIFSEARENRTPIGRLTGDRGLRAAGLTTTLFKPFNEVHFVIAQIQADLNGNFSLNEWQPLSTLKYSGAIIWGWKKSDRKMIGVGISRSYRAGELAYMPGILLNWTHVNRKWGIEMLAPARAHIRRTFSPRKLLFFGYELEGQSYYLQNTTNTPLPFRQLELRRSELRIRSVYEVSLKNFIWLSVQAGLRLNYSFHADDLKNGKEFYRGFSDRPNDMRNEPGHTFYAMIGLHLVSP